MLWMFRRVFLGPLDRPENQRLEDVNLREICLLAPIVVLIFFMGVYPRPFLSRIKSSARLVIERVESQKLGEPVLRTETSGGKEKGSRGN
jgi:NADH-quinone oxidoreductase subunit M